MPITGFTADSVSNGISFVSSAKLDLAGAVVANETLAITNGARLNGAFTISSSIVHIVSPIVGQGTSRGQTSVLGYINSNEMSNQSNIVSILGSQIFVNAPGNTNIVNLGISNAINSQIVEFDGRETFVYIQPGANLQNAIFSGIKGIEFNGAVSTFSRVSILDTSIGVISWQAGRIDIIGLNLPSTSSGYHGVLGIGGNSNQFRFWNSVSYDLSKILLTHPSSLAFEGFTATWRFVDSVGNVAGVNLTYSDNRTDASVEIGQYVSGADGTLTGTVNSKNGTVTSSQGYPTLWVLTARTVLTGEVVNQNPQTFFTFDTPWIERLFTIAKVIPSIDIKSYRHIREDTITSITEEIGSITPQELVASYSKFVLSADSGVTQLNSATVAAYTGIARSASVYTLSGTRTLNEVYDFLKLQWSNVPGLPLPVIFGNTANFSNASFVINSPSNNPTATSKYSTATTTGDITLAAIGDYSATPWNIPAAGVVTVQSGTTSLVGWSFSVGATINVASGTASVSVSSMTGITAGTGVTLQAPQTTITLEGIPSGAEVRILQGSKTIDYESNVTDGNYSYSYFYVAGERVKFAITSPGFVPQFFEFELAASNQSLPLIFTPDSSYIP